jgi:hypothetical protein
MTAPPPPLSPAAQAYKAAYIAFDKVKNTFCRIMVDDNVIFDNQTLDNYKVARDNLIKAQEALDAELRQERQA